MFGSGQAKVIASAAWSVPLLRLMQRTVDRTGNLYLTYLAWHKGSQVDAFWAVTDFMSLPGMISSSQWTVNVLTYTQDEANTSPYEEKVSRLILQRMYGRTFKDQHVQGFIQVALIANTL